MPLNSLCLHRQSHLFANKEQYSPNVRNILGNTRSTYSLATIPTIQTFRKVEMLQLLFCGEEVAHARVAPKNLVILITIV